MKPDWSKAPEWAGYAAQELSGTLYWHELEPRYLQITGEWRSKGRTQIIPKVDRPAQDTLERRPESGTMVERFVRQRDEQADSRISAWFRSWNA